MAVLTLRPSLPPLLMHEWSVFLNPVACINYTGYALTPGPSTRAIHFSHIASYLTSQFFPLISTSPCFTAFDRSSTCPSLRTNTSPLFTAAKIQQYRERFAASIRCYNIPAERWSTVPSVVIRNSPPRINLLLSSTVGAAG